MSKETLKLALEALKECRRDPRLKYEHPTYDKAIKALEEALKQEGQSNFCPQCEALARELKAAKQEQGEPDDLTIAYMSGYYDGKKSQQRKPLTDEQKIVLGFLDGSNPLQNVWYGEDHPAFGRAKHWWRRFLRQAFADDFEAHGIKE